MKAKSLLIDERIFIRLSVSPFPCRYSRPSSIVNTFKAIFIGVFITLSTQAFPLDCSSTDIILNTQEDVDNFQSTYGGGGICDRVTDFLVVSGNDITNIDGLANLTNVGFYLAIRDNDSLTNLDGLVNLSSAGSVELMNNTALTNIDGLFNFTSVESSFFIWDNGALTNIDGLANLSSAVSVIITNNGALTNIDGLANLTSVEFRLDIADNSALTNIDGLANFILTDAHLNIINNDALTNIDGLAHLVSGGLTIDDNDALTNLNSLTNLTSVNSLFISDNDALTNIDGLANLASVADHLRVTGNTALANLDGLANVTSVGLTLGINSNAALTNLDGLANLISVGSLYINSNAALTNLGGLSNLTSVGYFLKIKSNTALTNVDGLSGVTSVGFDLDVQSNDILLQCVGLSQLIDQWDDAESGPGPGAGGVPDVGGEVLLGDNLSGCNSVEEILATVDPSKINPGLNDAWYNPLTDGQGFYINIFPDLGVGSLSWFTYDTELPGMDETANLGDPGHRWLTAVGPIVDNQVFMEIELTSGGLFDTFTEITRTDPSGSDGTIILTFNGCNSGTVEYDIPSINRQGVVPIRRVANDNIALCEALNAD